MRAQEANAHISTLGHLIVCRGANDKLLASLGLVDKLFLPVDVSWEGIISRSSAMPEAAVCAGDSESDVIAELLELNVISPDIQDFRLPHLQ